jgi:hypothetical protein
VISPDVGKFNCPIFHPLSFLPLIQLQTRFGFICTFIVLFGYSQKKEKLK